MKEDLAQTLARVVERLFGVLEIFDLSFFVSGSFSAGAILMYQQIAGTTAILGEPGWSAEFLGRFVLASYGFGLLCHGLGQRLRRLSIARERPTAERLAACLKEEPASRVYYRDFFDDQGPKRSAMDQLYSRLWAVVRDRGELKVSYDLLNKYWMLAASFDGLSMACLVWLLPILHAWDPTRPIPTFALTIGTVLLGWVCLAQARTYREYQMHELVATVLNWEERQGHRTPSTETPPQDNEPGSSG